MGFKSTFNKINKYNPYRHKQHIDIPVASTPTEDTAAEAGIGSANHEAGHSADYILRGGVADSVKPVQSTPAQDEVVPDSVQPDPGLYSRTRALGPAPVFDDKDTNGALHSGLTKGRDAFLKSGNPFAFLFGGLQGATYDKTYDERQDYKKKLGNYDAQYQRAAVQDKAEADTYFKRAEVGQKNRQYQLDVDKFKTEKQNKTEDNSRADEQLARSIVQGAMKRQGGRLMEVERKELERIFKQPIGDSVPPEIATRLLQMETPQGNVYGVTDINSTAPARTITGPDGQPVKVKKNEPLVQILSEETKNAETEAAIDVPYMTPEKREASAVELARQRAIAQFGDVFKQTGDAFFSTNIGKPILDQARKDVTETDKNTVDTERSRRVLSRRKQVQNAQQPKGDDNNITPSSDSKKKVQQLLGTLKQ
jgi:hypothetical protein